MLLSGAAMETSLFLAKVFGLYFMVTGLVAPLRRKDLMAMVEQLFENRPLIFVLSFVGFVIGLLLVVSHNVWLAGWPVVVTILAWLVLLKALVYLLLPFETLERLIRRFGLIRRLNREAWFTIGGAISFLLGVFLAGKGFQIF